MCCLLARSPYGEYQSPRCERAMVSSRTLGNSWLRYSELPRSGCVCQVLRLFPNHGGLIAWDRTTRELTVLMDCAYRLPTLTISPSVNCLVLGFVRL